MSAIDSCKVHAVLVGAGHAHLDLLHQSARLRRAGVRLTLVAPRMFHYSGLATGVLSGALAPEAAAIDVAALARHAGVDYRPGRVAAIDRAGRRLLLDTGESLSFDAVSLNVGSEASARAAKRPDAGEWTVKPLDRLFALRDAIEESVRKGASPPTVVVAGGGQTGCEVAAAIAALLGRLGLPAHVFLAARGAPAWGPPEALRRLHRVLTDRGVTILDASVVDRGSDYCRLSDGQRLPCDHLVWATGLRPPPLIAALGLPLSADSRLRVTPSLCSIADEAIFGVGDCAVLDHAPRPTAGVFGVRAAPVLLNNLAALADGRPVRRFNPQRTWLSIMDLGDGQGLAIRGGSWSLGRPALRLKRYLDLGFVRRMRAPVPAELESPHDGL
ncbi:FAD-dependent oxidoreductase [Brevundimonas sp.]|uniref:FAD-dependent oxidoreductase n=3 Tax=Brevundimonas sp. TaxID=1871086 RepID=UPI0027F8147D|nr:FAD-dependent oxidoreductase [Brevundimonas sp.]MDQ7812151.1 FAD-dependent oxidoreductase [Brevundimonas sp.]